MYCNVQFCFALTFFFTNDALFSLAKVAVYVPLNQKAEFYSKFQSFLSGGLESDPTKQNMRNRECSFSYPCHIPFPTCKVN